MGCKESKPGCCEARRKKEKKTQYNSGQASCELIALKAEANTDYLHNEAEKRKAALLEKQMEETTRLQQQQQQQQQQEEEDCLKEVHHAETHRLSQHIQLQVEKEDLKCKQFSENYDMLKREQEETLQKLQKTHDQEKLFLTESYQKTQASLQETIDKLTSQLKAFQEKMKRVEESILSRDYKKHIQDYGTPSQFWEQELESLHFVIEMKNERIHSLDKKLLNLEIVMESNLLLEEKIKILQQENEDLQVRMQNHMTVTRQLSEELLTIREALEKETQLREQGHREKEELLYRVLHGDSGHPFAISTETSLIAT
ncbi:coiled-coil domain-containing protein 69 [Pantherophis guttatus]|uniref:Coiled-coil domain-containing protein 69 n=1 Tax=Pantherophis guttatus TaxID=94885 RepID=A0A6P9AI67_PANGU|nr:coiled-coil domain-containing protein 69 [Pantherophis guttatus]